MSAAVPEGPWSGKRAEPSTTSMSPPPVGPSGSMLAAAAKSGMVCELAEGVLALATEADCVKREVIKERVLACANTGTARIAKRADPAKRLKNNALFAFFAKYRLTTEEVSVL